MSEEEQHDFRLITSLWAHFAMFCVTEEDKQSIDNNLRDLLAIGA